MAHSFQGVVLRARQTSPAKLGCLACSFWRYKAHLISSNPKWILNFKREENLPRPICSVQLFSTGFKDRLSEVRVVDLTFAPVLPKLLANTIWPFDIGVNKIVCEYLP